MITKKKDMRLIITGHNQEEFKDLVIRVAQIETSLAHIPAEIPLDVFMNFTGIVSRLLEMYSSGICQKKGISYIELNKAFTDLKDFRDDIVKNLSYSYPMIVSAMNSASTVMLSIKESLTVGKAVAFK